MVKISFARVCKILANLLEFCKNRRWAPGHYFFFFLPPRTRHGVWNYCVAWERSLSFSLLYPFRSSVPALSRNESTRVTFLSRCNYHASYIIRLDVVQSLPLNNLRIIVAARDPGSREFPPVGSRREIAISVTEISDDGPAG